MPRVEHVLLAKDKGILKPVGTWREVAVWSIDAWKALFDPSHEYDTSVLNTEGIDNAAVFVLYGKVYVAVREIEDGQ